MRHEPYRSIYVAHLVALLEMIYTHLAAALLAAVIAAAGAWTAQSWRLGEQVQASKTALESLQREHAEALTRATASALNATLVWQKAKDDALDRAQQRAKTQAAHAAAARRDADSLRSTLASASLRLPDATPSACVEYATASSGLLDQCAAQYQELAAVADGHVSTIRLMQDAWPTLR